MELQQLQAIYETYVTHMKSVLQKTSTFDGLWGFGNDPKKDPSHMKFYEDVDRHIEGLLQEAPPEEQVFQAAQWIIHTPPKHENQTVYWCMLAVHGPCKKLVPLLSREHCAILRDFYDKVYLQRNRLPVQQDLYKALKKRAK